MPNTTTTSKSANGTKAASRKPTASKSAKSSTATPRRASDGKFKSASAVPPWAAVVASAIGVGVAVGAGLYATRRQWMPQAERLTDQIASRFRHAEDDHEFFGDAYADRDDQDDLDIWDGEKVSRAAFPDRDAYPGAQAVS